MEKTDREDYVRTSSGAVVNNNYTALQSYKRQKALFRNMAKTQERLTRIEEKFDLILQKLGESNGEGS